MDRSQKMVAKIRNELIVMAWGTMGKRVDRIVADFPT